MATVDTGPGHRPAAKPAALEATADPSGAGPDDRPRCLWRVARALILLAPVLIISACFFPGHMSGDTLAQIGQARDGRFTNQHAPLLIFLWHLVWPLGVRPGWVLVIQVAVFVAGTYLVLRSFLGGWIAASASAAIALSPPVFGMLGYLSRDSWFTALLMATFGLLAWSLREEGGRRSSALLLAAVVASWLALASRQNAIAAVAVADVAIAWRALGSRLHLQRIRWAMVVALAGLALTAGLFASQVAMARLISVRNVHPEQYLFIYDLEMLSHDMHRNLFPTDVMARRDRAVIEQYYNIDSVNPLLFPADPPVPNPLSDGPLRSLRRAWKRAIADHPSVYLHGRFELWLRQISLTRAADFIYHPVIDPNPWGLRVRSVWFDRAGRKYVETFANPRTLDGGPLHRVWVYLVVDLVGALTLMRRRMRADQRLVYLLALAGVTHQAGVFLGAMGTQYRFQFPVVVVGMVVLLALANEFTAAQRTRRRRRS